MSFCRNTIVLCIYLLGFHAMPVLHWYSHSLEHAAIEQCPDAKVAEKTPKVCSCCHQHRAAKSAIELHSGKDAVSLSQSTGGSSNCNGTCHLCEVLSSTVQFADVCLTVHVQASVRLEMCINRPTPVCKILSHVYGPRGPPTPTV